MKGLVWLIGTIFSWLELLFLFLVIHLLFMYFWLCLKYLESNKHALETFLWQNWMHQLCFWDLIKDPGTSFNLVKKLVRMRKYFQKWSYNFKMWCSRIVVMWCSRIKRWHVSLSGTNSGRKFAKYFVQLWGHWQKDSWLSYFKIFYSFHSTCNINMNRCHSSSSVFVI